MGARLIGTWLLLLKFSSMNNRMARDACSTSVSPCAPSVGAEAVSNVQAQIKQKGHWPAASCPSSFSNDSRTEGDPPFLSTAIH